MKWVTRENANVDRIACPWLIRKFVDPAAEFLFLPWSRCLSGSRRRAGGSRTLRDRDRTRERCARPMATFPPRASSWFGA